MEKRSLGKNGPQLALLGLGCMGLSGLYGKTDDENSIKVVHAALDRGVSLLNTGDFYGIGHNEMLVGRAIKDRRDQAFVSVKYGALRSPDGAFNGIDTRPAATKNFLSYSLVRLGVDYIDLYQPARKDPDVPIEETIGAIAEMVKAGYVRHIGLSEVSAATLRRAHAVHPIAAVEHEYSLFDREIEDDLLPTARELGVAIVAYGVLSRGMIQSKGTVQIKPNDFRTILPRFLGENLAKNNAIVLKLQELAATKNATATQLAFAWVLSRGEDIFPLIGAKSTEQLNECLESATLSLDSADLAKLDSWIAASAVSGTRYPEPMMAMLKG